MAKITKRVYYLQEEDGGETVIPDEQDIKMQIDFLCEELNLENKRLIARKAEAQEAGVAEKDSADVSVVVVKRDEIENRISRLKIRLEKIPKAKAKAKHWDFVLEVPTYMDVLDFEQAHKTDDPQTGEVDVDLDARNRQIFTTCLKLAEGQEPPSNKAGQILFNRISRAIWSDEASLPL